MPLYEYKCSTCNYNEEKLEFGEEIDEDHICPKCDTKMDRLFPNKTRFKLMYDPKTDMVSWSNEGYASSQYWSAVKKQRSEGKNVKPYNED